MAAPVIQNTGNQGEALAAANLTNPPMPYPPGVQLAELLLGFVGCDQPTWAATFPTSPPWADHVVEADFTGARIIVASKRADAADVSGSAAAGSVIVASGSSRAYWRKLLRITDAGDGIEASNALSASTNGSHPAPGGMTTPSDECLVIQVIQGQSGRGFNNLGASRRFDFSGAHNGIVFQALAEGAAGEAITVQFVNTGALSVSVVGNAITINVQSGVTTAAQVIAAVNAHSTANTLVRAARAPGDDGTGVVQAHTAQPLVAGYTTVDTGITAGAAGPSEYRMCARLQTTAGPVPDTYWTQSVAGAGVMVTVLVPSADANVAPIVVVAEEVVVARPGEPFEFDFSGSTDDSAIASYAFECFTDNADDLPPLVGADTATPGGTAPGTPGRVYGFEETVTDDDGDPTVKVVWLVVDEPVGAGAELYDGTQWVPVDLYTRALD